MATENGDERDIWEKVLDIYEPYRGTAAGGGMTAAIGAVLGRRGMRKLSKKAAKEMQLRSPKKFDAARADKVTNQLGRQGAAMGAVGGAIPGVALGSYIDSKRRKK